MTNRRKNRFKKSSAATRKARPENEISEQDVETFLQAIKNFAGYPKLKDLRGLVPAMSLVKINTILRYLDRSKKIFIDNDGYITWISGDKPEGFTLAQAAVFKGDHLSKILGETNAEGESEE